MEINTETEPCSFTLFLKAWTFYFKWKDCCFQREISSQTYHSFISDETLVIVINMYVCTFDCRYLESTFITLKVWMP